QKKNSFWRVPARVSELLATSRCGSLSDHSRTGKLARARCKARPANKHEQEVFVAV
ncbi:hypothetical protein A2U01_0108980, partial [Trifolium medium]|nr:hypothetical protein [Trifolium medium]